MIHSDPKEWEIEARSRFRQASLPIREWPGFRDRYIVSRVRELADRHQAEVMNRADWSRITS
jgi:hypothetical protein